MRENYKETLLLMARDRILELHVRKYGALPMDYGEGFGRYEGPTPMMEHRLTAGIHLAVEEYPGSNEVYFRYTNDPDNGYPWQELRGREQELADAWYRICLAAPDCVKRMWKPPVFSPTPVTS